jgi:hypothetical protein
VPGEGIVIAADGVTLNLNGHTIAGDQQARAQAAALGNQDHPQRRAASARPPSAAHAALERRGTSGAGRPAAARTRRPPR